MKSQNGSQEFILGDDSSQGHWTTGKRGMTGYLVLPFEAMYSSVLGNSGVEQ